jgi:FKBP-type peptidyl-prolyl cis-trans isomerase 2
LWVKRVDLTIRRSLPVHSDEQTSSGSGLAEMQSMNGHFSTIFKNSVVTILIHNLCGKSLTFQVEVGSKRNLTTTFQRSRVQRRGMEKSDEETFIGYSLPNGFRRSRSRIGC